MKFFGLNKKQKICFLLMIFLVWLLYFLDKTGIIDKNYLGLIPGNTKRIYNIFSFIFVHKDLNHLISNFLGMISLLAGIIYYYPRNFEKILLVGIILSGLGVYFFGRPGIHLGSSIIIYLLFSFFLFKGIFTWNRKDIALALLVIFIFNGILTGLFPYSESISWEGHLSAFISGIILSIVFKTEKVITDNPETNLEPEEYKKEELKISYKNDIYKKQISE